MKQFLQTALEAYRSQTLADHASNFLSALTIFGLSLSLLFFG